MKSSTSKNLRNRKRRIEYRLRDRDWCDQEHPMLGARNVHYEVAERTRGFAVGGLGAIHQMAQSTGLVGEIARRVQAGDGLESARASSRTSAWNRKTWRRSPTRPRSVERRTASWWCARISPLRAASRRSSTTCGSSSPSRTTACSDGTAGCQSSSAPGSGSGCRSNAEGSARRTPPTPPPDRNKKEARSALKASTISRDGREGERCALRNRGRRARFACRKRIEERLFWG